MMPKEQIALTGMPLYAFGVFYMEIKLTKGYVAFIDAADYSYVSQFKWYAQICGGNLVYAARRTRSVKSKDRKIILMHRDILGVSDRKIHVDHIDHDTRNNQRNNLRACTPSQNLMNQLPQAGRSSKYKGVYWSKAANKFQAHIKKNGRVEYLGIFINETDAAMAYDRAAIELFGEFAYLNIP